ncbi:MAG TPA: glycerophosphodiester phosphodiesterase [Candidatus Sulfomarinibacteraceae bacterium]|nr:glycerophosphodiester phosphodiesterase [Candidatus Sulfomarinibacteraceae bacterium]
MTARRALRLAHRGDWRAAPENTLAAMRAALAIAGCDGLELDVRASREGVPILLHDETLDRVQGRDGRPGELSLDELAAAGIPTLADVLATAGPGPFLDVELKGEPVPAVVGVLEAARGARLERAVISSFEAATLAWLGGVRPAWPRWLNAEDLAPATLRAARDLGCRGVAADWRAIDGPGAERAAAAGLEVAAWTVRRRATATRLERLGVVAICVEAAALDG